MNRRAVASSWAAVGIVLIAPWGGVAQQPMPLTQGLVIDRSVTIRPGSYSLSASPDLKTPAITIRGDNITVDFNGAVLTGGPAAADPDTYTGVGILIDGGSQVTLKNAVIRGYKVGILARNSPDLHLTHNDLSYNWKQRLYSGIEKESLVDWMSYHQNEKDEWLRYGAAIYLSNCERAEIDHNTAVQGQNGLLVTASNGLRIWNNRFQFLSSLGVGLYRVTASTIMHNRIDWCVRGYSHGFYNRGQDSAGLLMYEQSSNNVVAYNSITHGGDGLFLWAGQSTMDTGEGGSNDNLFYGNDFSHAPTNGIEATFSRNKFVANRVEDCWHGVWGGYSFGSLWTGNRFAGNAEAIAIEHGYKNVIYSNTFEGDSIAIRLWQNASQDPSWGYLKYRDTRSRDYNIEANTFVDNQTAVSITDTRDVTLRGNRISKVGKLLSVAGEAPNLSVNPTGDYAINHRYNVDRPSRMPEGIDPMLKEGERRGRDTIVVDEWGPFDWKSPKLWPALDGRGKGLPYKTAAARITTGPVKLDVLGPAGVWKLADARGAAVFPRSGKVGDTITVTPRTGSAVDWQVALEYTGASITSPRGTVIAAGVPYRFDYSRFFVPISWTIRFYQYDDATDPVKHPRAFATLLRGKSIGTLTKTDRIDYLSGGVFEDHLPRDRFAFAAEGTVTLPPGDYSLQVISDDGARVWADGILILDAWEPHESRVDRAPISGGTHRLRVEYFEVTGWAEMRLDIQPQRRVR